MDQLAAWLGREHVSIVMVLITLALLIGATILAVLMNRVLRRWLQSAETRLRLPDRTARTVMRVASLLLWLITLIVILDIWGVGVGGVWTVLVSAVTVIGVGFLATWTMVSNVTASLFLTLWRPFRPGDVIEILPEKTRGRLIDRNLMFTVLREDDGGILQIPNNMFFQKMFRVIDSGERPTQGNPASRPGLPT
jgi:small-conductance mechanosensitive channel